MNRGLMLSIKIDKKIIVDDSAIKNRNDLDENSKFKIEITSKEPNVIAVEIEVLES